MYDTTVSEDKRKQWPVFKLLTRHFLLHFEILDLKTAQGYGCTVTCISLQNSCENQLLASSYLSVPFDQSDSWLRHVSFRMGRDYHGENFSNLIFTILVNIE
jgi:hypothetical protein